MALRFRCEHCGKRLQVDVEPGVMVACPYCRNTVTVPADAQTYNPGQQQAQGEQQGEYEEEMEETTGDAVVAFMATYLPSWGTSVVLHLALILICLMSVWATQKEPEIIEYNSDTEKVKKHTVKKEVERSAPKSRTTRRAESLDSSSFAFRKSNNPTPDLANNNLNPVMALGVGGGGRDLGGLSGFGNSRGGGSGGSDFFGVGGIAKSVVYVVDRSGSMTDSIMYVKYELRRSIRALKPTQEFYVVFYSSGPAMGMPAGKLIKATEHHKLTAYEFIDGIVPIGQTDPSQALEMAFKTKPEVIYLLTDGEFDPKITGLIDKLNRGKKVTVHTFCFIYTGGEAILMKIASNNNGKYKYIAEGDLHNLGN